MNRPLVKVLFLLFLKKKDYSFLFKPLSKVSNSCINLYNYKARFILKMCKLFTFFGMICFVACTSPVSQSKEPSIPEVLTTSSSFGKKRFNKKIKTFSGELSKNYSVQQDSLQKTLIKNCNYDYFNALLLKYEEQKNSVQFQFYGFSKIELCDTAQHKLLENLGDLAKVKPGKNLRYIKSSPLFIIKNEDNIVLMQYACENNLVEDEITELKEMLEQQFTTPKSKIVNIECGGPLEWF